MNTNKLIFKSLLIYSIIAVTVSSCKKEEGPNYDYFVSKDLALTYTKATINSMMDIAVQTYPEISDLKPLVISDINVFKMVYYTTIDGKEVKASGLVCIPATAGEYPVLSFQNGTNTVNAYAPTEFVTNPPYQLVEFIASMGFVVVIPDYPGFGASVQIPHPYLIAEPTVASIVDMLRALNESGESEFPGITIKNEYYLLGYSQGGWATLALHKAMEQEYTDEFNLNGSVCGAGPYNMYNLFLGMVNTSTYPMPSYLGYIINAYSAYHQFTNPVSDILNEPYATRLSSLYTGTLTTNQINNQLTTFITEFMKEEFLSGFVSSVSYSTVREALINNSISAWNSTIPLLLVHGDGDTQVSVTATETMYDAMINAGTSTLTCKKIIFPGLDHSEGIVPCMTEGLLFLIDVRDQ
ncbi:MAG: alpha/beta fold hydrolase [Bacteroidales bacterium]|nr:alpha/beta fold hydrolase [Bacteroidales bacterium]